MKYIETQLLHNGKALPARLQHCTFMLGSVVLTPLELDLCSVGELQHIAEALESLGIATERTNKGLEVVRI